MTSTEIRKDSKSELKDIEKRPEIYKDNTDKAQQNLATRANKLKTTITKRTTGLNRAFNKLHGVAEASDKKEMTKSAEVLLAKSTRSCCVGQLSFPRVKKTLTPRANKRPSKRCAMS